MAQPLTDAEREKLRKIIGVMRSATIEGERKAAEEAAMRLAAANGMTLEEAEQEAFIEEDDGRIDADERAAQQREAARWAANMVRMTNAYEASEKYRFMMAKEEAKRRGLAEKETDTRARRISGNNPRRYIPGKADEFRLIAGLLRDGVSVERTAELVGVSTVDVARIWLLTRGNRAA